MTNRLLGLLLVLPLVGAEPAGYKYWSAADLKSLAKPLSNKSDAKTSSENLGNFGRDHAAAEADFRSALGLYLAERERWGTAFSLVSVATLDLLVRERRLPIAAVDRAVTRVLTQLFAHGLVDRPESGTPGTAVDPSLAST